MSENKKIRAEKREEKKKKLTSRQVGFSAQKKRMEVSKEYKGDVKRFVK